MALAANGQSSHEHDALFQPLDVGNITIKHRIVMAPLTRYRANSDHVHEEPARVYYEQRGQFPGTLLITEGTFIHESASGFEHAPGIYTDEQVAAWKRIVDAVHKQGSFIFLQLWALGRAAQASVMSRHGLRVLAPSAIGLKDGTKPIAMSLDDIKRFQGYYAQAAHNFVNLAGGDGVEIHGANGYLIDQFFSTTSNARTDEYGGTLENRLRFGLEVVDAVAAAVGPERTAIRISPYSPFQEMKMPIKDTQETFGAFVKALKQNQPNLAYLHVVQSRISGASDIEVELDSQDESLDFLHSMWGKPFFIAGGLDSQKARKLANEKADTALVFGRHFIANPDLVHRIKNRLPLNKYDRSTFYTEGPEHTAGYTDYPSYS